MSITQQERALIDEAIAAGRVTKIAEGKSSVPDVIWCPKGRRLVYVTPVNAGLNFSGSAAGAAQRRRKAANRANIADLLRQGRTDVEIAQALGLGVTTVAVHRRELVASGAVPAPARSIPLKTRIIDAFDPDLTATEIADLVGASRSHAVTVLKEAGLGCKVEPRVPSPGLGVKRGPGAAVTARRARVLELKDEGLSAKQIASVLHVSVSAVHQDANAVGVRFERPSASGKRSAVKKGAAR